MTFGPCPRESAVREAAVSGRWPADLLAHVGSCASCAETHRIAAALQAAPTPPPFGVEPRALFACARHVRRLHVESKISLIVTTVQAVALTAVLAVLLSFVKWPASWPASISLDHATWVYAAAGLALAAVFGLSRWLAQAH